VRTMPLEEIARRLEDRFALLRGGDRSAPGRHRTLFAVIDWSWNLLDDPEQRALRRLALFHDGFTLAAAEAVLGDDSADAVQGLVDQSLLSVGETPAGGRYRMLETVREFGGLRLADAGEAAAAREAQRRWAAGYARHHGARLATRDQFSAVDAIGAEEVNLADELRGALADGDRGSLVQLLASLGLFWTLRGEHIRVIVLAEAVTEALLDWVPPPDLLEQTCGAVMITLSTSLMTGGLSSEPLRAILVRLGREAAHSPHLSGLVRVLLTYDADAEAAPADFASRLGRLADSQDRPTALAASQWLSVLYENAGDPVGAITAASRALALSTDDDGPWAAAMPHTMLAQLTMQVGDLAVAVGHAQAALPVMRRLGASDDEIQLRSLLVLCAIADGRLADAKDELNRVEEVGEVSTTFGGGAVRLVGRAELALASGDYVEGLRIHREAAARMRAMRLPGVALTGLEPWVLFGDSVALAAHARYAEGADAAHGRALFLTCRDNAIRAFGTPIPGFDYPAAGQLLFALGAWALFRRAAPAGSALRLLALAHRFAYNPRVPTMLWERIVPAAEEAEAGRIDEFLIEYRDRQPTDLLAEACRLAEELPS
jgi:hypothetical protein